ncbi:hypothetical protein E3N88_12928 [Mikania micrantha]|uniref:Uncharacterized protein n=1 Tax=Mikania micrantha TaxID=192012 RepID=A0A5N6P873_9ASTR|nr:hypothetical protein E3N88_12928 [Mikania micrantha]
MVSIVINAAMYRACSSPHLATKEPSQLGTTRSLGTKQDSTFVGLNIKDQSGLITHNKKEVENDDLTSTSSVRFIDERWKQGSWDLNISPHLATKEPSQLGTTRSLGTKQDSTFVGLNIKDQSGLITHNKKEVENDDLTATSSVRFIDERWKQGSWDLNIFVKSGKMDWDALIVAEARRRKFLELYPEEATNQEPVLFRSSIIPWWAWITHSHLPEAELLNAAMIGFFMAYLVDVLTGLDVVGQSGNFICKIGLFMAVIGVVVFRQKESLMNLKNLAEEATFYDKQWKSSWQDQDSVASGALEDKMKQLYHQLIKLLDPQ